MVKVILVVVLLFFIFIMIPEYRPYQVGHCYKIEIHPDVPSLTQIELHEPIREIPRITTYHVGQTRNVDVSMPDVSEVDSYGDDG